METTVMPEPQNVLTRQFTEAEWTALKEFRTNLPFIFAEAFPTDASANTTPVTIWGVAIDPNKLDARASVVLMHFLRARSLDASEAAKMFVATLRWRAEFNAAAAAKEEFPTDVFGKAGYVFGKDKAGRPVTYNVYGGDQDLQAMFGDLSQFLRWRVGLMEKGLSLLDFETVDSLVQVHDYEGVGMSSRTPESKKAAAEATKIFQDYYPETLHKKFFINVPYIMTWIFFLFRPLLSAQTFAKMQVLGVGPKVIGPKMLECINSDQLPKQYGGIADAGW